MRTSVNGPFYVLFRLSIILMVGRAEWKFHELFPRAFRRDFSWQSLRTVHGTRYCYQVLVGCTVPVQYM